MQVIWLELNGIWIIQNDDIIVIHTCAQLGEGGILPWPIFMTPTHRKFPKSWFFLLNNGREASEFFFYFFYFYFYPPSWRKNHAHVCCHLFSVADMTRVNIWAWVNQKSKSNHLKISIDPLGQPSVPAGSDHCFRTCYPYVRFQNLPKQNIFQEKTMFTILARLWIWPSGSLMTPVLSILANVFLLRFLHILLYLCFIFLMHMFCC